MNKTRPSSTSADPTGPEPTAAPKESCTCGGGGSAPDPTDDDLQLLRRLRDISMAVAEKLAGQILNDDAGQPAAPTVVLSFQRAERGVRQSILLSNKLRNDRRAVEMQSEAVLARTAQQRRERRKKQVARVVTEAIQRGAQDKYETHQKLAARIDEDDIESDIGRIPDSAIIARLCADCGVAPPWELWAGEHWALEEARLAPPGSVYAGSSRTAAPEAAMPEAAMPETGSDAVEPEADGPAEAEALQAEEAEPEADEPGPPKPEPPSPMPDSPYEASMKRRLAAAMRSGGWMQALQMDPVLTCYVRSRLLNSS